MTKPTDETDVPVPTKSVTDKLAAIARVLGCDPNDEKSLRAAFESLFRPVEQARASARKQLSERQAAKVKAAGVCPVFFLRTLRRMGAR